MPFLEDKFGFLEDFCFSRPSPITHPPLNLDPDSIINFSVEISPLIIHEDFNINNSSTLTLPLTFPAISALTALTLPSTIDVSPQTILDFDLDEDN